MIIIPLLIWLRKAVTTEHLNVLEWLKEGFTDPKKYRKGMSWFE